MNRSEKTAENENCLKLLTKNSSQLQNNVIANNDANYTTTPAILIIASPVLETSSCLLGLPVPIPTLPCN